MNAPKKDDAEVAYRSCEEELAQFAAEVVALADYDLRTTPDRECDAKLWHANMAVVKLARRVQDAVASKKPLPWAEPA